MSSGLIYISCRMHVQKLQWCCGLCHYDYDYALSWPVICMRLAVDWITFHGFPAEFNGNVINGLPCVWLSELQLHGHG